MSKLWITPIWSGNYKLAPSIERKLTILLSGLKNRNSAFRLFVFLARFNASPKRINKPFPIDRRALADRQGLGLTENEVRGAIVALRRCGVIEIVPNKLGDLYERAEKGVKRLALQYQFSFEFLRVFRYIVSRYAKSPKDRQESSLDSDSKSEAPLLGDLKGVPAFSTEKQGARPSPVRYRAPEAPKEPLKPLREVLSFEADNPLHAALKRLARGVLGGRAEVADA